MTLHVSEIRTISDRVMKETRSGFWYLATPYSLYPKGHEAAWKDASGLAGALIGAGIPVFCPIAHSHPISMHGDIPPTDHDTWLPLDQLFMESAIGLIVAMMEGWESSRGVAYEIAFFDRTCKPTLFIEV